MAAPNLLIMRPLVSSGLLILLLATLVAPALADRTEIVREESEALKIFARARAALGTLGLVIPRDVPLKYRTRDELMVENNSGGGRAIELDGFYRPYNPEEVWIVRELSYEHTIGAMAHELTHAWQTTESPMQDRKLKEGFARWVEYKVLMAEGCQGRAWRLTQVSDPDYGGGLRALLEIENKEGIPAVIEVARKKTAI